MRDPLGRLLPNLPRPYRVVLDWVMTIAGAVLIVLGLKAWVVNPYRIPSSSMEPTLHCAKPAPGCEATFSDRVLACRVCLDVSSPRRGQIIVFETPPLALGGALEYPHYTRPPEFRGWSVPDVLLSGDHGKIESWRKEHVR